MLSTVVYGYTSPNDILCNVVHTQSMSDGVGAVALKAYVERNISIERRGAEIYWNIYLKLEIMFFI